MATSGNNNNRPCPDPEAQIDTHTTTPSTAIIARRIPKVGKGRDRFITPEERKMISNFRALLADLLSKIPRRRSEILRDALELEDELEEAQRRLATLRVEMEYGMQSKEGECEFDITQKRSVGHQVRSVSPASLGEETSGPSSLVSSPSPVAGGCVDSLASSPSSPSCLSFTPESITMRSKNTFSLASDESMSYNPVESSTERSIPEPFSLRSSTSSGIGKPWTPASSWDGARTSSPRKELSHD
ncbi:hypothetical protein DFH27DRAFT_521456 [Peziza echinospora]|nr:hypothetical protein DFH27DRAFT_521456 [Peziza echinospora]